MPGISRGHLSDPRSDFRSDSGCSGRVARDSGRDFGPRSGSRSDSGSDFGPGQIPGQIPSVFPGNLTGNLTGNLNGARNLTGNLTGARNLTPAPRPGQKHTSIKQLVAERLQRRGKTHGFHRAACRCVSIHCDKFSAAAHARGTQTNEPTNVSCKRMHSLLLSHPKRHPHCIYETRAPADFCVPGHPGQIDLQIATQISAARSPRSD